MQSVHLINFKFVFLAKLILFQSDLCLKKGIIVIMKTYLQKLHSLIENLEKPILVLMYRGFFFSLSLCLLATFLLLGYITVSTEPLLFYIGFSLLKSGLFFGALFYIYAIVFDGMAKRIV